MTFQDLIARTERLLATTDIPNDGAMQVLADIETDAGATALATIPDYPLNKADGTTMPLRDLRPHVGWPHEASRFVWLAFVGYTKPRGYAGGTKLAGGPGPGPGADEVWSLTNPAWLWKERAVRTLKVLMWLTPRHSPDFRTACWYGTDYEFSPNQAVCIRVLWEAWENKTPTVADGTILEKAAVGDRQRLRDVFKGHDAWKTMIVQGHQQDTHKLSEPGKKS